MCTRRASLLRRAHACLTRHIFAARLVSVLVRFGRGAGGQPSQPGRTSPDS
ncbi:DUF6332 family protein [Streptomyces sp. NPDC002519]